MAITLRRQISDEEKKIVLARHGRQCFATGHAIPDGEPLQYDHIRAFASGGQSELDNIAPMCEPHNKAKGTLPLEDFRVKLELESFFREGERLTLRNLLEHFKAKKMLQAYGESVQVTAAENAVHLENHDYAGDFPLFVCPRTGWKYFYATLPTSILNSDDDEDHRLGLQPRFLIFDKVFDLFRHFQHCPVLQPSVGRISDGRILLFDGQHKAAALLWNNQRAFECKIYLNPDVRVLNQTNIAAHDKFAQMRFFSSVMILKLGGQFGNDFEDYRRLEDGTTKSERGFMDYLENAPGTQMTRGDRNKRFRSYLYNSIMEDAGNKTRPLVSVSNRSSATEPLTVDMLSKSLFACFLYTEPVTDDMASDSYKREQEFSNNITLLNLLYDLALGSWNPKPTADVGQLALARQFSSKSIMAWSELLRDAVCAKLDLDDADDRARPFYRDLSESDFAKIRRILERLLGWQMWKAPGKGEIDTYIAGNKSALKNWFKAKGLTAGFLAGASE